MSCGVRQQFGAQGADVGSKMGKTSDLNAVWHMDRDIYQPHQQSTTCCVTQPDSQRCAPAGWAALGWLLDELEPGNALACVASSSLTVAAEKEHKDSKQVPPVLHQRALSAPADKHAQGQLKGDEVHQAAVQHVARHVARHNRPAVAAEKAAESTQMERPTAVLRR